MAEFLVVVIALFFIFVWPILWSAVIFPLPVKDSSTVRYRTFPWMTATLIAINCCVFFFWQGTGYIRALFATDTLQMYRGVYDFSYLTEVYSWKNIYVVQGGSIGAFVAFTSMFMHGSTDHLFGNMIYLWAFGRRVEDATGPWRFLVFYLFAGLVATIGSAVLHPGIMEGTGAIGASGAVSGVMAAYLFLFPGSKVDSLWGIAIGIRFVLRILAMIFGMRNDDDDENGWRWTIRFPAWILLIFFAVDNITSSLAIVQSEDLWSGGGTNTIAHMTGFLAGAAVFLFVRKDLLMRYLAGRRL